MRARIWQHLQSLAHTGVTIIITTHYIEEARDADKVGIMREGRLLAQEPPGLVFVDLMACKTPIIGANSGGSKESVITGVGELVDVPAATTNLPTVPVGIESLGKTFFTASTRCLKEDWETTKEEACIRHVH